jgi:hypothetical protein
VQNVDQSYAKARQDLADWQATHDDVMSDACPRSALWSRNDTTRSGQRWLMRADEFDFPLSRDPTALPHLNLARIIHDTFRKSRC